MDRTIQDRQDNEYEFPYHYVSKMPQHGFSQHYVDTWGINYISTIEFMLEKIQSCNPNSVIDIGCGDGRFTREVHSRFPGCKVVGIDYSSRAINLAKAMNQDRDQISFSCIDITQSETRDKYDIAILMEVFEHIPPAETDEFLKGVRSSLKEEGVLLLTVPHVNKPVEYKHFQHFSFETIKESLSPYFNAVEIIPFEKKGLWRRLLDLFLCNRFFVLNNRRLLNLIYRAHSRHLFHCEFEHECQRIFVIASPK